MKVQGAKKVHYDSGPNMTPLVDVVMVILIFLMLAGSFAGATQYLLSKQGIHQQGTRTDPNIKPDPNQPPDTNIRIDIAASGFVAECKTPKIGPTSSPEELKAQLDALRERMVGAGYPVEKLQIVLMPGRGVKYKEVLQVYTAALQANFQKVALATSH